MDLLDLVGVPGSANEEVAQLVHCRPSTIETGTIGHVKQFIISHSSPFKILKEQLKNKIAYKLPSAHALYSDSDLNYIEGEMSHPAVHTATKTSQTYQA